MVLSEAQVVGRTKRLRIKISKAITTATNMLRMLTVFPIQVLVPSTSARIFLTRLSSAAGKRERDPLPPLPRLWAVDPNPAERGVELDVTQGFSPEAL
jgi:hypothetical protein